MAKEGTEFYPGSYSRDTEDWFRGMLSPIEPLIMRIQSLLVWERPNRSVVLFVIVHGIFWFIAKNGCQFYFCMSSIAAVMFFVYTWRKWIWPEIRVPPPIPEDSDGWTPVHVRLLSVPEICQHLAQLWIFMSNNVSCWAAFRQDHHFLFTCLNCSFLLLFAAFGRLISGLTLTYIIVMSLMLWPCVLYNNLFQKLYLALEPLLMRLDYTLKIRPWIWRNQQARKTANFGSIGTTTRDSDSDSDELMPTRDPQVTAALARAITDSEDEGMGVPEVLDMVPSRESSVTPTEDQHDFSDNSDIEAEFARGLGQMPSLDHLIDEEPPSQPPRTRVGEIEFVSSHFADSTDEDLEDTRLGRGMKFPDLQDLSLTENTAGIRETANQIVSSVMGNALSGIKHLAGTNSTNLDNVDGNETKVQSSLSQQQTSDTSDVDIAEEFDFLDEYEVEES
ncbi:reticulophagy regulator 3-like [Crassostrea virginica]|uniref:Reticulophagy regulator 3-like isoform X1 n=1 Tax=Crassostrea virginica TaxID=6565 RepID=A0A8B8BKY7_CRAVI|nr:reticulophagy regulator 3-like isoform X1 [Crassostrea virginica]